MQRTIRGDMEEKFKQLVTDAQRIMVTSHISPDPDAVASALLLAETLKTNFPDKQITMVLEEQPAQHVEFLHGYDEITFQPILTALQMLQPTLLIITDADDFDRISRSGSEAARQYTEAHDITVAVVDHHPQDEQSIYQNVVNRRGPAAAQEVYHLCFMVLGWKKPENYQETALLGIITDTVRFRYANPLHHETFAIVNELLDAGADIQLMEDKLDRYTDNQIEVLANLAVHTKHGADYTYTFVDDDFFVAYIKAGKPYGELKGACGIYGDEFIRKIGERRWGFIISPDPLTPATYKVSFRAITGAKDVSKFAVALGGGGHIPAAAASLKARTIDEAVQVVMDVIAASTDRALGTDAH